MFGVLRVCIVFLSVYSVVGQMPLHHNRSQTATAPSLNVAIITPPSVNTTARIFRDIYEPEFYDAIHPFRRHFPYHIPHVKKEPPKEDPWPHRPHTLNGSSSNFSLPKCCPEYSYLDVSLMKCKYEEVTLSPRPWLKLPLDKKRARFPPCAASDVLRLGALDAHDLVRFSARGTLLLHVKDVRNVSREVEMERETACADVVLGENAPFGVLLCPCKVTACVRKCCGKAQAMTVREVSVATATRDCKDMSVDQLGMWNPQVVPRSEPLGPNEKQGYVVLLGTLPTTCKWGFTRAPPSWAQPKPEDFRVLDGGVAIIKTKPETETDDFCVDGELSPNGSLVRSIVFCAKPMPVPTVDRWMAALGVVGTLALAATVAVHALLPELRVTPFGRALTTYAAALLVFAVIGLAWTVAPDVSRARCILNITWSQYFQQAAAFWLNIMCYDIGIAFSSYKKALDKSGKAARRRYIRYAQYAWGCPFITGIPVLALQFSHQPGSPWRPIEVFMKCRYSSPFFELVFLYLPLLLLLILNCAIFVWTAYRIRMLTKDAEILTEDDTEGESQYPPRKKMLLFLKLLWLMGVSETLLELIAWSVSTSVQWHTANVVDFSRALCVFWLSCCKGTVLRRLRERLRDILSCEALRRGSRVGPDPDAEAATAAAAAARDCAADVTDSTDAFSVTDRDSVAQTQSSDTAAQDATWNAKPTHATSSTVQDGIFNTQAKNNGHVSAGTSQNGLFKGTTTRGVTEKEMDKDNEPPPSGIQMKVISTTSL